MNASSELILQQQLHLDGRILLVSFNRADAANAINLAMGEELLRLAEHLEQSPAIEAVIFTGKGRLFSGGGDLGTFRAALEGSAETSEAFTRLLSELTRSVHGALNRIAAAGPLLVAAVNGPAAGAGLGLICACDYAFARPGATLRAGFSKLGLSPDSSSTYFLPRIVGYRKALDILIGGEAVNAEAAVALGLYERIIDASDVLFLEQVIATTTQLIAPGRAVRETRRLLRASGKSTLAEHLDLERESIVGLSRDPGVVARIRKALGLN